MAFWVIPLCWVFCLPAIALARLPRKTLASGQAQARRAGMMVGSGTHIFAPLKFLGVTFIFAKSK